MRKRVNTGSYHLLRLTRIQQAEVTDITIMNNKCGTLSLSDSTVVPRGRNILSKNSAVNGGGISLFGNSYIIMENGSRLEIINNTADELGGGVFAALRYPPTLLFKCFIRMSGEKVTIHFEGNKAGCTGSDLYHRILQESWWSIHMALYIPMTCKIHRRTLHQCVRLRPNSSLIGPTKVNFLSEPVYRF